MPAARALLAAAAVLATAANSAPTVLSKGGAWVQHMAANPPELERIAAHPARVHHDGKRGFRFLEEVHDPLGGHSRFEYSAVLMENVVRVDANPHVSRLSCDAAVEEGGEGGLTVEVDDAGALEGWTPGTLLAGQSEVWACKPFTAAIVSIESLTLHTSGGDVAVEPYEWQDALRELSRSRSKVAATARFHTSYMPPPAAFESLDLHFSRTAGENEPALRRMLHTNASFAEEVYDKARRLGILDGGWGQNFFWERYLIKWQYDSKKRQPIESDVSLLGEYVYLHNSHAYIGGNIKLVAQFRWATLENFELSAFAGATAAVDVQCQLPEDYSSSQTTDVYPGGGAYKQVASLSFSIAGVPVIIDIKNRLRVNIAVDSVVRGTVIGPGFMFDQSLTLGIRYTQATGWAIINERQAAMDQRAPLVDIQGNVNARLTLIVQTRFTLWKSWDVELTLSPFFNANLDWAVAAGGACNGASALLQMSGGMNAAFEIFEPVIKVTLFGTWGVTYSLKIPGLASVFPMRWDMQLQAPFQYSIGGSVGCVPATSLTPEAAATIGKLPPPGEDTSALQEDVPPTTGSRRLDDVCGSGCTWAVGQYGDCNVDCGLGRKERSVVCRSDGGGGSRVDDALCTAPEPVSWQACEVACSPLYLGGGSFNKTYYRFITSQLADPSLNPPLPLPSGVKSRVGLVLPYTASSSQRFVAAFTIPADESGLQALLYVDEGRGDPSLYVRAAGMSFSKASKNFYDADEIVSLSTRDGAVPGGEALVSVSCKEPVDEYNVAGMGIAIEAPGACAGRLEVFSFTDVTPNQMRAFTTPVGGTRLMRYRTPAGAVGLSVSVWRGDGEDIDEVDLFVTRMSSDADWPSLDSSDFDGWSTVGQDAEANPSTLDAGKSILITDDEYAEAFYSIALVCDDSATAPCTSRVLVSPIFDLRPGEVASGSVFVEGLQYYRVRAADTDTVSGILVRPLLGEVTLMVSQRPFVKPPRQVDMPSGYELSCPSCLFTADAADARGATATITHLDPLYSRELHIAVYGSTGSTFAISAQSYERLDDAVPVRRGQAPSTYAYFLSSPPLSEALEPQEQKGLSYNLRARVLDSSPGSVTVLAGSAQRFYPAILESFTGLMVSGVQPGEQGVLRDDYLYGSIISRQMIAGVRADYHGVSLEDIASGAFAQAGNDGTQGKGPVGRPDTARRLRGLEAAASTTRRPTVASDEEGHTGSLLQASRLPDIIAQWMERNASFVEKSTAPAPVAGSAERRRAAARFADAEASLSTTVAGTHLRAHGVSVLVGGELWDAVQTTAGRGARQLQAASLANPLLLLTPPQRISLALERFLPAAFNWTQIAQCQLTSPFSAPVRCVQQAVPASSVTFYRMRVPARHSVQLSVLAAARPASTPADAPYTVLLGLNALPTHKSNDGLVFGSAATFTVPNCLYTAAEIYVAVTTENPGDNDALFDVYAVGSAADSFICEAFTWSTGPWSGCSADCGTGIRTRAIWCTSELGQVVDDSFCPALSKPASSAPCDSGSCAWVPSDWGLCSLPCGTEGLQLRNIECRNGGGSGVRIIDGNCDSAGMPSSQQRCNVKPCSPIFWDIGPWTDCSAECGGGTRTRKVQCVRTITSSGSSTSSIGGGGGGSSSAFETLPAEVCQLIGTPPSFEEKCNDSPCAETLYDLVSFDSRKLRSGVPATDHLAPGGTRLFTFERPFAAATGVCIVATPMAALDAACSMEQERAVASCLNVLSGCLAARGEEEQLAALQADTTAPHRLPMALWRPGANYSVPAGACDCFARARDCVAARQCSLDVKSAAHKLADTCELADGCAAAGACSLPQWRGSSSNPTEAVLSIAVSRYWPGDLAANPFLPPTSPLTSEWTTSATPVPGQQRLVIYGPQDGYTESTNTLLVGVTSKASDVDVEVVVTALSAYPLSFSGSLAAAAGVSAAAIRAGGLTLSISLSCDAFVDPSSALLSIPYVNGTASNRTTANIVASGLYAVSSSERGWNRVARPLLLEPLTASFARIEFGGSRLTLTLPPVPGYRPSADETIELILPGFLLRSGRSTPVEGLSITVQADASDCVLSQWGAWSECSIPAGKECGSGLQTRSRSVLRYPVTDGVEAGTCPPTTETRVCNTCDACASMSCANGLCVQGACVCAPGWAGASCNLPPTTRRVLYWRASPWEACSSACGGTGSQRRSVTCWSLDPDGDSQVAASQCSDAGIARPLAAQACNPQACTEPRLDLTLRLNASFAEVSRSSGTLDAFAAGVVTDLASVLDVAEARMRVTDVRRAAEAGPRRVLSGAVENGEQVIVSAVILPHTASFAPDTKGTLVGTTLDRAMEALRAGASDPDSALRTRGTFGPRISWSESAYALVRGPRNEVVEGGTLQTASSGGSGGADDDNTTGDDDAAGDDDDAGSGGELTTRDSSSSESASSAVPGLAVGIAVLAALLAIALLAVVRLSRTRAGAALQMRGPTGGSASVKGWGFRGGADASCRSGPATAAPASSDAPSMIHNPLTASSEGTGTVAASGGAPAPAPETATSSPVGHV